MNEFLVVDKIGEYKKAMKAFVKGMVRSKLAVDEDNNVTVVIEKTSVKETNKHYVKLTIDNPVTGVTASFNADVTTRIFNKIDPSLFEKLAEQLHNAKASVNLIVE